MNNVTIEAECAECGYPYIYVNSQDPCPRCGSLKKLAKVKIQAGSNLSTSIEVETKKEQIKLNKKVLIGLIIIFITSAILSFLFSQFLIFVIGVILDIVGIVIGFYAIQKTIEKRIQTSK